MAASFPIHYRVYRIAFWILIFLIVTSPITWIAWLNWLGPSTEYHHPVVATAERGPDGRDYIYVGEEMYVTMFIIRHKRNGNCRYEITRYAEVSSGPRKGTKFTISYASLQFVGNNELRRARWPSPPDKYIVGYAVDEENKPQLDEPLLPPGVDEEEFVLYVVGRYYCNFLDYIFPRYIQGGERPDETAHVHVVVKRRR